MTGVVKYPREQREYVRADALKGRWAEARLVGPDVSPSIQCKFVQLDQCVAEHRCTGDEIILCLEGRAHIRANGIWWVLEPGDVLWIPAGGELRFEVLEAQLFHVEYIAADAPPTSRELDEPHGAPNPKVSRRANLSFFDLGAEYGGRAAMGVYIGGADSGSIGCATSEFDECSMPWTVHYDEVLLVLEGLFRMPVGDVVLEGRPGDVFWIPAGTSFRYEGERALVYSAIYPLNWRKRIPVA